MSKEFIPENELEGTNYHLTCPWFDPGWPQKFREKNLSLKFWFVAVLPRYDRYLRQISVNEFLTGFIFDLMWPWFGPEWPKNWILTQNCEMALKKLCWEIVLITISQFLKFLKLWFLVSKIYCCCKIVIVNFRRLIIDFINEFIYHVPGQKLEIGADMDTKDVTPIFINRVNSENFISLNFELRFAIFELKSG